MSQRHGTNAYLQELLYTENINYFGMYTRVHTRNTVA